MSFPTWFRHKLGMALGSTDTAASTRELYSEIPIIARSGFFIQLSGGWYREGRQFASYVKAPLKTLRARAINSSQSEAGAYCCNQLNSVPIAICSTPFF